MRSVYLKCALVGAAITFVAAAAGGVFFVQNFKEYMRILSDGFFTAGALIACCGALVFADNFGVFDVFGYVAHNFYARIAKAFGLQKPRIYADFYEYKRDKRTKRRAFPLLTTGSAFTALSALCLALYYI